MDFENDPFYTIIDFKYGTNSFKISGETFISRKAQFWTMYGALKNPFKRRIRWSISIDL